MTSAPDTPTPPGGSDSGDTTPAEGNDVTEQRWAALARRRYLPPFIKRYALRRMDVIAARDSARFFGRRDPADNQDTRMPVGEQVQVPVIWLTELYTPTTLVGLLDGLPQLLAKAEGIDRGREDLSEWVRMARRRGGGAWRMLPYVFPPDSALSWPDRIVDALPDGIAFARLGIYTLTSTVTAVTAMFQLDEACSRALGTIVNQDMSTRTKLLPHGGHTISDVRSQKQEAADAWRTRLRADTAGWLAERLPGSFHRLASGQLSAIEFLLTEKQPPWEEPAGSERRVRGWRQLLDLEDFDGYWQCASLAWLRLRERRFHGRGPGQRHVLTLAGLRPELLTTFPQTTAGTSQLDQALRHLDFSVIPLANRWALTALLRELDEQLAVTRDLTERASSKRSPRALTQIQQQLIRTGMDSQIVAADIVRYAENEMSWRHEILDFTDVQPPALAQQMTPQASLADTMRQGQINLGGRVTQAEADLRDLLNTSAQLTAAAENLRLQRRVWWLTCVSLLVAAIAAAAAVAALHISTSTPTPAPAASSHPASTQPASSHSASQPSARSSR